MNNVYEVCKFAIGLSLIMGLVCTPFYGAIDGRWDESWNCYFGRRDFLIGCLKGFSISFLVGLVVSLAVIYCQN